MSWSTEHPDSLNDIPRSFLTQFEDQSWHNDVMPNFRILGHNDLEENQIILWIDYEEVDQRESEDSSRFCVVYDGENTIFETNDFEKLVHFMENGLDSWRITALQAIAKGQLEELVYNEDHAGSDAYTAIENMFWAELIKATKHTESELEDKFNHNTEEERYTYGMSMLSMELVRTANNAFREDPSDEKYQKLHVALTDHFGDKVADVFEIMYTCNSIDLHDRLWLASQK